MTTLPDTLATSATCGPSERWPASTGHAVASPATPRDHAGFFRRRSITRVKRPSPESLRLLANLQKVATGDHPALAQCYDLMGGAVFSLAVRMLRDRPAAEDVTQDIFVQVWRQAGNFDASRGSPEAW